MDTISCKDLLLLGVDGTTTIPLDPGARLLSIIWFGELRGETARNALAVYAGMKPAGFNAKACEKYKLLLLRYDGAEWPVVSIPDTRELIDGAIEYSWHNLYQPCQSYERLSPDAVSASKSDRVVSCLSLRPFRPAKQDQYLCDRAHCKICLPI